MPTAAAQIHANPQRTVDDWDRHARDYYNGMKQRKRISLKNEREIDSMFEKLDLAKTPQEKQKMRVELWKTINLVWVSTSTHHMKRTEGFLFRDEDWERNVREKYTLLTKRVAGAADTEKLWTEQMREHIAASDAVLAPTTDYVEGYNERIAKKRGLSGIVIRMGTALFGIEPKPMDPLVFHQSISPGVEDYAELLELEKRIMPGINARIEPELQRLMATPAEMKTLAAKKPKARDGYINKKRQEVRNQLIWNEINDPDTVKKFYRAIFDSHFGATLDTTARGPSPSPAQKSNIDRFADALMNFPDPFKNFTYRNIMDWIDEKIK
jgi:hypothetical protein